VKKGYWLAVATAFCVGIALAAGALIGKWPFSEARIQRMLENRTGREVRIGSYQKIYWPPGFIAQNIRFLQHEHPEREPPIEVGKVVVKGSWGRLMTFTRVIPQLDIYKVHLVIPPRGPKTDGSEHDLISPKKRSGESVAITAVSLHELTLDFVRSQAAATRGELDPYRLFITEMVLTDLKEHGELGFEAVIENSVPKGEIHVKGRFGPWNSSEPARTPVGGNFTFQNARLGDIPGISGTMQSKGDFWGTLDREETRGDAVVPDFRVKGSTHSESLRTVFRGAVDVTDGDVTLQQVDTTFGKTTVSAQGTVSGEGHPEGKMAVLKASVTNGRVDDLEKMFTHSNTPPLTGMISLHTSIKLPAGKAKFLERLQMTGDFETSSGKFTSHNTQDLLNRLKESAKGESKKQQDADREEVSSRLKSHVVVKGGVARIENLVLEAPETMARMDGIFNLLSKEVDLKGTLKTEGKVSDTQSGFKAFAVKLITPFLKKQHTTFVPFEIKGPYGQVTARLDLGGQKKL